MGAGSQLAARCARHPEQPATTTCGRCGAFVCMKCLHFAGTEVYCDDCYQLQEGGKSSPRAVWALVLGLVGINCLPFLGIPALIMASAELEAIERGESPRKGLSLAKGARILGWIEIALCVAGVVGGVLFFLVLRRMR